MSLLTIAALEAEKAEGNSGTTPFTFTVTLTPEVNYWADIAYGNGVFVALATAPAIAATSPDGITWTQRNLPAGNWKTLVFGNGLFVAVSATATIATSPDGITWTQRTGITPASSWHVAFGAGVFVAVSNALAMTSPDGITWTSHVMPAKQWRNVAFGNALFVATSQTPSTGIVSSPDGITWTTRAFSAFSPGSLVFGAGLFVLAKSGDGTVARTSSDAITWTARTMPAANEWRALAWSGSRFLAVGPDYGGSIYLAATSTDGITWAQSATMPAHQATGGVASAFGAGLFVTAWGYGPPDFFSSPTGVTWASHTLTVPDVTVAWTVTGSGDNPAPASEFIGGVYPSGTVTIAAGQTFAVITVPIAGNTIMRADYGFTVTLSAPVNAALDDSLSWADGVIQDDDTPPAPAAFSAIFYPSPGKVR